MVNGADISRGVAGSFAMAKGEEGWLDRLDLSAGGVFASFWALPLALPAVILTGEVARQVQASQPGFAELVASPVATAIAQVAATLLAWAASLLILSRLASKTSEGWRVTPLLIGYNWSRLLVHLVAGLGAAIAVAGGTPLLFGPFALGALVLSLWLTFGVVKRGLGTGTGPTVGVMLMLILADVLVSLLVNVFLTPFTGGAAG